MKSLLPLLWIIFLCVSCENTNLLLLTDAAGDAVTAATLTDEQVIEFSRQAVQSLDTEHQIAPQTSSHHRRLHRLTAEHEEHDGLAFTYRVYLSDQINAFALADGSIRVYSGLMELMTDEELLFVIGHEMGHVVQEHSRRKVAMAYASRALRKGLASQDNEVGQIARSVLGGLAEQLANAQFSQNEERQADDYGLLFLKHAGRDPAAAVSALEKLAELARRHTILSSHPDPESRARRLAQGGDQLEDESGSWLSALLSFSVAVITWILGLLGSLLQWLRSLL